MDRLEYLHPQLKALADLIPNGDLSTERLPAIRKAAAKLVRTLGSSPEGVSISEMTVPARCDNPAFRALVYQPDDESSGPSPAIILFHGGGYVTGEPEQVSITAANWCKAIGATVICPAYRLAPENPYPAALEDAYSTLAWANENAQDLGIDSQRIAVAGESAGGGLAAGLTHLVRDRGEYRLCFQYLLCPMLDDRTCVRENVPLHQGAFVWTNENNAFGWSAYLTGEPGREHVPAYAAAGRATCFDNLPPAFIVTGDLDLFCNEIFHYAKRLTDTGIPLRFSVYPGAPHAFPLIAESSTAKDLQSSVVTAFKEAFEEI